MIFRTIRVAKFEELEPCILKRFYILWIKLKHLLELRECGFW